MRSSIVRSHLALVAVLALGVRPADCANTSRCCTVRVSPAETESSTCCGGESQRTSATDRTAALPVDALSPTDGPLTVCGCDHDVSALRPLGDSPAAVEVSSARVHVSAAASALVPNRIARIPERLRISRPRARSPPSDATGLF